jgi:hypothetical protein
VTTDGIQALIAKLGGDSTAPLEEGCFTLAGRGRELADHPADEHVGQFRIAGQRRPVQIGADEPAGEHAIDGGRVIGPPVAVAHAGTNAAEGPHALTKTTHARVVLIARQHREPEGGVGLHDQLAHGAPRESLYRLDVGQPYAFVDAIASRETRTDHLQAGAHGQY